MMNGIEKVCVAIYEYIGHRCVQYQVSILLVYIAADEYTDHKCVQRQMRILTNRVYINAADADH